MDEQPAAKIERTTSGVTAELTASLVGLDAVIMPGIPGMSAAALGLDGSAFPSSTTDVMKILREQGLKVEFEARDGAHPLVSHKAADWWVPITVFIQTSTGTAAGNLLSQAIMSLIGHRRADSSVLHVKMGIVKEGGDKIEWFEGHGKGSDVLKALRIFRG